MNQTIKSLSDEASKLAQRGLDGLSEAGAQTGSTFQQLAQETSALTHRGMDALRTSGQGLHEKSSHARQLTTDYIQHQPIKAVLLAAAAGATLMGILGLMTRQRDHVQHRRDMGK